MIRRDYILRMIEEFMRALARIQSLQAGERWTEAALTTDEEFKRLLAVDALHALQLSDVVLLAKLAEGEPTHSVQDRALMVATLFKKAGDTSLAQEKAEESRQYYVRGLHLLLDVLGRSEDFECPAFVPKVEEFVERLHDTMSMPTQALLMQHYERTGQFDRAEDMLFAMLEVQPFNEKLVEFGITFYERLQRLSDSTLEAGNLPRVEIEGGLDELREWSWP